MSQKGYFIEATVAIKKNKVYRDGKEILREDTQLASDDFLKETFKKLGLKYPKFYKMDKLSKLGFLAAEILFGEKEASRDTALVFANSASSLDTDIQFRASMEDFASPGLFVYTLPNIVLGEISIRHHLQSENAFFIAEDFPSQLLHSYTQELFFSNRAHAAVCGWTDLKSEEYDVFLALISAKGTMPFSAENLDKIYHFENE